MMQWNSLIRPIAIGLSQISTTMENRRSRKLEERLSSLNKELLSVLEKRRLDITDFEATNVVYFYMERGSDGLQAIEKYISLLRNGGRLPASEEECWRSGYRMRKKLGTLTSEDDEWARRFHTVDIKKLKILSCLLCLSSFVALYSYFATNPKLHLNGLIMGVVSAVLLVASILWVARGEPI